ncbi:glycoside hydrolase family 88 protein [Lacisediminimonas profundi]|uniref:glycoside hydrolase family 88 protein n=1 Tax=Lacisediminimonas profundi TaxID=2603856 RepID=UPI00124B4146|nr:glycoside hydrolase family 88 protein [Lacisediminimonas profundi]
MAETIVRKMLERGLQEPIDTGGKHAAMLNGMHLSGHTGMMKEQLAHTLAGTGNIPRSKNPLGRIVAHPNISDSMSRIRPLILAGHQAEAREALAIYLRERVEVAGTPVFSTAPSTPGWIFADTAYMVPPSLAIMGRDDMAISDLVRTHDLLALPNGLIRHVLNAAVPVEDSYCKIDVWIDGTAWGRANGWWLAGVVDTLEVIDNPSAKIISMFKQTCESLVAIQEDGFWRVTVDDSYSLIDTSATVMIGYGLVKGYQLGLLDKRFEEAGVAALEYVLRHHFDLRTGTLHHQQSGPLIVNVGSPNPRYLSSANPYGQGFLASLYSLVAADVNARDLKVRDLKLTA